MVPPHGRFTTLMFLLVGVPLVALVGLLQPSKPVAYGAVALYGLVNFGVVFFLHLRESREDPDGI